MDNKGTKEKKKSEKCCQLNKKENKVDKAAQNNAKKNQKSLSSFAEYDGIYIYTLIVEYFYNVLRMLINVPKEEKYELVKEIQKKAQALKGEKEKLDQSENALAAMQKDKEKFYALLNPRQAFINIWTSRYNELVNQRNDYEFTVLQELQSGRKLNADRRNGINRRTKRGNAAWNRLHRHAQLMKNVSDKIQSNTESTIDIATLAGKKFDSLTNKEIVSFIRTRFGYDTSTIAADVLERTHKDNTNALSGRDEKPPYYPKGNTNDLTLQKSIKAITGNPDIAHITKDAFATWDKTPEEAPPKIIIDVLDSYYTAEDYYKSTLSGQKWNVQHLDKNYNPDAINHDYNNELKEITIAENTPVLKSTIHRSVSNNLMINNTLATQAAAAKKVTEEADRIKEANSPYTTERIRLNKIQIRNLERLLDKIITPKADEIYKAHQEERKKSIFSGKITPAPDLEKIKEALRKKYTDKNGKPTYSRVTNAAKEMKIDISAAEATRDALKANYNNWHDETGNLLDVPKNAQVAASDQTKPHPTTQKEMPVEVQRPTVKRSKSKLDEIAFEKQADGSYKEVSVNIRWNENDNNHEKSEMEKVEEEMTKDWNPGIKR